MENITQCCICQKGVVDSHFNSAADKAVISCRQCGNFSMDGNLTREIVCSSVTDRHLYAGAIRELNELGVQPYIDRLETVLGLVRVPRNPIEMMDRILLSLQNTLKKAGESRSFEESDYPVRYATDYNEFCYLIRKMRECGYLNNTGSGGMDCQIEIPGWRRLTELDHIRPRPRQAFVAMRFHADMDDAWEKGIRPALEENGFEPLRVDRKEHDGKIDDLIISEIRQSGLLVADFTMQSQGVYFEAGFAMGLGIHVIRCCRDSEDETKKLHFDTRQYNHIFWTDPDDLRKKLSNRIRAIAPDLSVKSN